MLWYGTHRRQQEIGPIIIRRRRLPRVEELGKPWPKRKPITGMCGGKQKLVSISQRNFIVYNSIGVIQDNLEDYSKAIENYKKVANLASKADHPQLEAVAYNCIGVDLMVSLLLLLRWMSD